ncbi:MAG: glucosamine-6-phosphate deaminase [Clostridiales bacterium]|nr:glucosamine-6-phosphate deaminase [Clostridiales bacterium]
MKYVVASDAAELGRLAAAAVAKRLGQAIAQRGAARLVLSTGASQFDTLAALVRLPVDWRKVTMFHLDEYAGLPIDHPASFRKYLMERFVGLVPLAEAVLVSGEGDLAAQLAHLNRRIAERPIDVGVIGIGENGHIAFNDPPADFETTVGYHVVALDDACKAQQVREGWFPSPAEVPAHAISMTPRQIMACRSIVSAVPYAVKAAAVAATLAAIAPDPMIPASLLKEHDDWTLFLDRDSAPADLRG